MKYTHISGLEAVINAIALITRLLIRRCGVLPTSLENQVRSLSVEHLELLAEDLLDFQGLEIWSQS